MRGGALVYPSYDLGEEFSGHLHVKRRGHSFQEVAQLYGSLMDLHPEGYGTDRQHPDIIYVPEDSEFDLKHQTVTWSTEGGRASIRLMAGHSTSKLRIITSTAASIWRSPVKCLIWAALMRG